MAGPTLPTSGLGDCDQSLWNDCGWPTVGQQFQAGQASSLDLDASFAGSTNDSVVPTAIPTLSNGKHFVPLFNFNAWNAHPLRTAPFQYWGDDQSGPSTSTFNLVGAGSCSSFHYFVDTFLRQNVYASNQSSSGPARTGQSSSQRFRPYEAPRARGNEYWNTEAEPPTLVTARAQNVGSTTLQPTGGIPETVANANTTEISTEEEKVPVSHFYRPSILHVTDWLCDIRCLSGPCDPRDKGSLARAVRRNRLMAMSCVAW